MTKVSPINRKRECRPDIPLPWNSSLVSPPSHLTLKSLKAAPLIKSANILNGGKERAKRQYLRNRFPSALFLETLEVDYWCLGGGVVEGGLGGFRRPSSHHHRTLRTPETREEENMTLSMGWNWELFPPLKYRENPIPFKGMVHKFHVVRR